MDWWNEWMRVPGEAGTYKRVEDGKVVRVDGDLVGGDMENVTFEELQHLQRRAVMDREREEYGEPQMDAE